MFIYIEKKSIFFVLNVLIKNRTKNNSVLFYFRLEFYLILYVFKVFSKIK